MIFDRLEKGVATGDELVRELVMDDIEVYLDKMKPNGKIISRKVTRKIKLNLMSIHFVKLERKVKIP